eukprot:gene11207-23415_t
MCRFTVYKGVSIPIGEIILYPDNSLLYQSRDATYHPGVTDPLCRRNIRVNGDGFGIGWYNDDKNGASSGSCLFKLTSPAWSNVNLRNIGQYVRAPVLFGHVRAASAECSGYEDVVISDENCHPFKYGRYTFMHNGFVSDFPKVKRALCMLLDDDIYRGIHGSTDSEHIFALFLNSLPNKDIQLPCEVLANTIDAVISIIIELCTRVGIQEPCSFNLALTDGINIISTRFRNGDQEPPSLYYSYGSNFSPDEGNFLNLNTTKKAATEILISSAPLSRRSVENDEERSLKWNLIPKDHMLICEGNINDITKVTSIKLRQVNITTQNLNLPENFRRCEATRHESLQRYISSPNTTSHLNCYSESISDSEYDRTVHVMSRDCKSCPNLELQQQCSLKCSPKSSLMSRLWPFKTSSSKGY